MKKLYLVLMSMFFISFASAEECSITNLASCISQNFFDFFLNILNAPIQPLLNMVFALLTEPVNISLFSGTWGIIVYILSMFYGLLLIYVGFKFIFAGYSVEQREKAKSSLARILIMMVLVQASFYIYELTIELVASLNSVVLNLVPSNFFLLTIDNLTNIGLQFVFITPYLIAIITTLIFLVLRYMIVSFGVIFFAIGIFFYFIEPLNNYGRLIVNFLFSTIFMTFFYTLIFLASSKLLDLPIYQNTKMLVMIGAFSLVNLLSIIACIFIIVKASQNIVSPVVRTIRLLGG